MNRTHKAKVVFFTIVPSPYQWDLFGALAATSCLDIRVYYLEPSSPDSPWPKQNLRPFELVLPGFWLPFANARWHFNWKLPNLTAADIVVLSSFSSWTGQWLMRRVLPGKRWLYWGERLRQQETGWREIVQRRLTMPLACATGIVGIGSAAEEDYARRFPRPRHYSIPYHCDLSKFLVSRRISSGSPFTFLFCGQMIRRKGVDLLLVAFEQLIRKGLDARLLLVGREADLPEFLSTVSPAARACIRYEGFKDPQELPNYFAQSDAFILPSRHDGWGVVVNQAIGAGLPVITSDAVGAGLDLVEENVNGLRFAAGDVNGLEIAMERLFSRPGLALQWGQASRNKALSMTPEAGAKKWAKVIESIDNSR